MGLERFYSQVLCCHTVFILVRNYFREHFFPSRIGCLPKALNNEDVNAVRGVFAAILCRFVFFIVIIVECHSRCLFLTIILIEIQLKSHKSAWDYITSTLDTKHVRIYLSLSFACQQTSATTMPRTKMRIKWHPKWCVESRDCLHIEIIRIHSQCIVQVAEAHW